MRVNQPHTPFNKAIHIKIHLLTDVTWKSEKPSPLAPLPQATVYTQVIKPS